MDEPMPISIDEMLKIRECLHNEIQESMIDVVSEVAQKINEKMEFSLRHFANPPIKGEITAGKLKWRGIKKVEQRDGWKNTWWIEQRGKRISTKFAFYTIEPLTTSVFKPSE